MRNERIARDHCIYFDLYLKATRNDQSHPTSRSFKVVLYAALTKITVGIHQPMHPQWGHGNSIPNFHVSNRNGFKKLAKLSHG
jgi:hypothetical protein